MKIIQTYTAFLICKALSAITILHLLSFKVLIKPRCMYLFLNDLISSSCFICFAI
jgi:hypothetical protein